MFATPTSAQIDSFAANPGGHRLQQPSTGSTTVGGRGPTQLTSVAADLDADLAVDGGFSDGSICDVSSADLVTYSCAGNIIEPTAAQIMELMRGYCNLVPTVFTSKSQR